MQHRFFDGVFRTAMMVDNDPFRDRFHNLFACAQHRPVMVDQKQQAAGRNMGHCLRSFQHQFQVLFIILDQLQFITLQHFLDLIQCVSFAADNDISFLLQ